MESPQAAIAKITLVAYVQDIGWCVLDARDLTILSGPHDKAKDARKSIETRAYRLAQGWTP